MRKSIVLLMLIGCGERWTVAGGQARSTNVHGSRFVQQAKDIVGGWAGKRSLSMSGLFAPNWADRTSLSLPSFVDPNAAKMFAFDFRRDGSYSYIAWQGRSVWTSHNGTFTVTRATDAATSRYPSLLTLVADAHTMGSTPAHQPQELPLGLRQLGSEGRTFRLRDSSTGGLLLVDTSVTGRDLANDIESFGLHRIQ